jgi:hypothetical protein
MRLSSKLRTHHGCIKLKSWSSGFWHILPWGWRQHGPPKRLYIAITLYGVITRKTSTWTSSPCKPQISLNVRWISYYIVFSSCYSCLGTFFLSRRNTLFVLPFLRWLSLLSSSPGLSTVTALGIRMWLHSFYMSFRSVLPSSVYYLLCHVSNNKLGHKNLICDPWVPLTAGLAQWYSVGARAGWAGVRVPTGSGNSSHHHRVQSGSGAHLAFYTIGRVLSLWGKAAGSWRWPFTSI